MYFYRQKFSSIYKCNCLEYDVEIFLCSMFVFITGQDTKIDFSITYYESLFIFHFINFFLLPRLDRGMDVTDSCR